MAAPRHLAEVIVISDNEDEDEEEQTINNPLPWTDVADRLLLMAKSRDVRDDEQTLLLHLGIKPTDEVQSFLHNTCEVLGELLVLLRGNNRRYRACETLVFAVCEVLSLMQTATCTTMAQHVPWVNEEGAFTGSGSDTIGYLYWQMDKWRSFVEELFRSSVSRADAIAATKSHLETLSANTKQKIESLQKTQAIYQQDKERAARQWVERMEMCRDEVKESTECVKAGELTFMILDMTFNSTDDIQARFQSSNTAFLSVEHHLHDTKLHELFYHAALRLVNSAPLVTRNQKEEVHNATIETLGSDMLEQFESYSAALQTVILQSAQCNEYQASTTRDRSELLRLAKRLEAFWLIHRNWLPRVVLETYMRRFEILLESNKQRKSLVGDALSRVCASTRADC
ncbi:hypothetical protein DVH05_013638 [Phytophthora capsici]|nr:hypothetical protein DVH05_013638 [Phytophthora capsici]